MIESLVEQIEARFAEAQAQMSDPEVIADRQRYADAGRAFNQLAPAAKLAEEWRLAVSDAEGARGAAGRGRGRRDARRARRRARADRAPRGGDPARDGRARPQRRQERDRRDPRRRGRRRGRHLGRRPLPHVPALRRAARLQGRDDGGLRRLLHVRDQGRRRVLGLQVRGRHAPRAARARDRVPGPHPHLDGDGRGAARGRGRRGRDRPERPADRRLPLLRARAGSRSTRPTRPCGSRTSRPGS